MLHSRASAVDPKRAEVIRVGALEIRPHQGLALAGGRTLTLSVREFGLLVALARRQGDIVPRADLYAMGAVLRRAGLAVVPADGTPEAAEAAHWVTSLPGGHGAVRETVELLLKAQGLWQREIERDGRG